MWTSWINIAPKKKILLYILAFRFSYPCKWRPIQLMFCPFQPYPIKYEHEHLYWFWMLVMQLCLCKYVVLDSNGQTGQQNNNMHVGPFLHVSKHCRRLDDGGDQDKALLAPLATPPLSTWNVAFPSRKPIYRRQDFFQLNLQYLKSVQTISSVGSSSSPSFPPHASPSSITAGMP